MKQIIALKGFLHEVIVELKKCSWPTWPELKQSTIVVIVSMCILGAFVGLCDLLLGSLIRQIFG